MNVTPVIIREPAFSGASNVVPRGYYPFILALEHTIVGNITAKTSMPRIEVTYTGSGVFSGIDIRLEHATNQGTSYIVPFQSSGTRYGA